MKKIKFIFVIGLFGLFIPRAYALSYDVNTSTDVEVKKGTSIGVNVSIGNIKDTTDGISACTMNISFDKNIALESSPRTLGNWTMTTGSKYLFDTGSPVIDKSDIVIIPVKVNGDGYVKLSDIVCSDGVDEVKVEDRTINFYIEEEKENNKPSDNKDNDDKTEDDEDVSNCNLSSIELSEGTIEFDPNVTEYEVNIRNFDDFRVTPKLEDSTSSYVVDKLVTDDGGTVVITVNGADGNFKTYTIYTIVEDTDVTSDEPSKFNYVPIFIGIIVLLVLVNVIRIIKNNKKK